MTTPERMALEVCRRWPRAMRARAGGRAPSTMHRPPSAARAAHRARRGVGPCDGGVTAKVVQRQSPPPAAVQRHIASGESSLPDPEIVAGPLHVPVPVALTTAWTCGVELPVTQTVSAGPLGLTAKYAEPTLVSPPDRTTGADHSLLPMEPLTANICDAEKPMNS